MRSRFSRDARFTGSHFGSYANFSEVRFKKYTSFTQSIFSGDYVSFDHAQFGGNVYFDGAKFGVDNHKDINLPGTRFCKYKNSNESIVNIEFQRSQFRGNAHFEDAKFYQSSNFSYIWFGKETAQFQDAQFKSGVSFKATTFPRFANFIKALFRGNADFAEAKFTGNTKFDEANFDKNLILTGARIDTMSLNNCQFKKMSEILLKEAIFNRLYIKWAPLKMHLKYQYKDGYDWAIYSALVKNFRDLVRFDDADACYYEYKKKSNNGKILDLAYFVFLGYGVKLRFPLFWVVLSISTFLYGSLYRGQGDWFTIVAEIVLVGIFLPLFIVVLARKMIR